MIGKEKKWDGEQDKLNPSRFVMLLLAVGAIVGLIWWAQATGHIKHVESVPPPPTVPDAPPPKPIHQSVQ